MEIIVKVPQNWSFWKLPKSGPELCSPGARIWLCFLAFSLREKSVAEEQNRVSILPAKNKTETYFRA
jgi:hypothetical protein